MENRRDFHLEGNPEQQGTGGVVRRYNQTQAHPRKLWNLIFFLSFRGFDIFSLVLYVLCEFEFD